MPRDVKIPDSEWEKHRKTICEAYRANELKGVAKYMEEKHQFQATENQYRQAFRKWKFKKGTCQVEPCCVKIEPEIKKLGGAGKKSQEKKSPLGPAISPTRVKKTRGRPPRVAPLSFIHEDPKTPSSSQRVDKPIVIMDSSPMNAMALLSPLSAPVRKLVTCSRLPWIQFDYTVMEPLIQCMEQNKAGPCDIPDKFSKFLFAIRKTAPKGVGSGPTNLPKIFRLPQKYSISNEDLESISNLRLVVNISAKEFMCLLRYAAHLASNGKLLPQQSLCILNCILENNALWMFKSIFGEKSLSMLALHSSLLWSGLEAGDTETVKMLFDLCLDLSGNTLSGAISTEMALKSALNDNRMVIVNCLASQCFSLVFPQQSLHRLRDYVTGNYLTAVAGLIRSGADVNADIPETCLQAAVKNSFVEMAELLLEAGANPNQLGTPNWGNGGSPCLPMALEIAVSQGNLPMTELLLNNGADPNFIGRNWHTSFLYQRITSPWDFKSVLERAVIQNDLTIAKALLGAGAEIMTSIPGRPMSPFHLSVSEEMTHLLSDYLSGEDLEHPGWHKAMFHISMRLRDTGMMEESLSGSIEYEEAIRAACKSWPDSWNIDALQTLIQATLMNNIDLNVISDIGETFLTTALRADNLFLVRELLNAGANPNIPFELSRSLSSPLAIAVGLENDEFTNMLLERGATTSGSPLLSAVQYGSVDRVSKLLDSGANVHHPAHGPWQCYRKKSKKPHTIVPRGIISPLPLHQAVIAPDGLEKMKLLLEAGAMPEIVTDCGCTALTVAVEARKVDELRLLLDYGADPNEPCHATVEGDAWAIKHDSEDWELPYVPIMSLLARAATMEVEIARILVEAGATVEPPGFIRSPSPLERASLSGSVDMVRYLVKKGANPRAGRRSCPRHNALPTAAEASLVAGSIEKFDALVEAGFDGNLESTSPWTKLALESAARSCNISLVGKIISCGADVKLSSNVKLPSLLAKLLHNPGKDLFSSWKQPEKSMQIVKILLQAGTDIMTGIAGRGSLLSVAVRSAARQTLQQPQVLIDLVKMFVEFGAQVNNPGRSIAEWTPLQVAAGTGHTQLVKYLLSKKADINAKPFIDTGRTALQAACEIDQMELVELLLSRGADVNASPCRHRGATALQFAARNGNLQMAKALLEEGAEINAAPCEGGGVTALEGAAYFGRLDMVALLLENGEIGIQRDKAVILAKQRGHYPVEKFLREWETEQ